MVLFVVIPWFITDIFRHFVFSLYYSPFYFSLPSTRQIIIVPHSLLWLHYGLLCFSFFLYIFAESVWIRFSNDRCLQAVCFTKLLRNDDQSTIITQNQPSAIQTTLKIASSICLLWFHCAGALSSYWLNTVETYYYYLGDYAVRLTITEICALLVYVTYSLYCAIVSFTFFHD